MVLLKHWPYRNILVNFTEKGGAVPPCPLCVAMFNETATVLAHLLPLRCGLSCAVSCLCTAGTDTHPNIDTTVIVGHMTALKGMGSGDVYASRAVNHNTSEFLPPHSFSRNCQHHARSGHESSALCNNFSQPQCGADIPRQTVKRR